MVKKFVYLFCFKGTVSVITHDLIGVPLIEEACSIVHQLETVKKKKTMCFPNAPQTCLKEALETEAHHAVSPNTCFQGVFEGSHARGDGAHCNRCLPSQLLTWSFKVRCI